MWCSEEEGREHVVNKMRIGNEIWIDDIRLACNIAKSSFIYSMLIEVWLIEMTKFNFLTGRAPRRFPKYAQELLTLFHKSTLESCLNVNDPTMCFPEIPSVQNPTPTSPQYPGENYWFCLKLSRTNSIIILMENQSLYSGCPFL